MKYDLDLITRNFSSRTKNKKQFIMLHHTGSTNFINTTKYLANAKNVSAHYTIGLNGEVGRIGNDNYVLWHSGKGKYEGIPRNYGNWYSIGIEVVSNGKFYTKKQIDKLEELVEELQAKYSIPQENIIRHKDYAPTRKWDIGDNFYKIAGYSSFEEWKDQLGNLIKEVKLEKIVKNNELKELRKTNKAFEKTIKKSRVKVAELGNILKGLSE